LSLSVFNGVIGINANRKRGGGQCDISIQVKILPLPLGAREKWLYWDIIL
jgi:hypothetical protein